MLVSSTCGGELFLSIPCGGWMIVSDNPDRVRVRSIIPRRNIMSYLITGGYTRCLGDVSVRGGGSGGGGRGRGQRDQRGREKEEK